MSAAFVGKARVTTKYDGVESTELSLAKGEIVEYELALQQLSTGSSEDGIRGGLTV